MRFLNTFIAKASEWVAQAAPSTPASGNGAFWYDSAAKHFKQMDDIGVTTDLASGASGTKVSALTAVTTPAGTDEFPVNQGGTSKKATLAQLTAFMFTAGAYAPGAFTVPTGQFVLMASRLTLTGSQRATLNGTARLRID